MEQQPHARLCVQITSTNFDVNGAQVMRWEFFAGLGVGAAVGMLVAPKSGSEVREDIQDFARNNLNRESLQNAIDEGRERMQAAVEHGREQMNSVRERVQPVMDQARDRVQSAVETVQAKAQQWSSNLLEVINEWPHEKLIAIDGIGPVLASKIIQHRPYKNESDLTESKLLPPSAIESLRNAA